MHLMTCECTQVPVSVVVCRSLRGKAEYTCHSYLVTGILLTVMVLRSFSCSYLHEA